MPSLRPAATVRIARNFSSLAALLAGALFVGCGDSGGTELPGTAGTGLGGSSTLPVAGSGGSADGTVSTAGTGSSGASPQGGTSAAGSANGGASATRSGASGSAAGASGSAGRNGGASNGGSAGNGGNGGAGPLAMCPGGPTPPATWTEHWFEHDQDLELIEFNDCVAIYFDDDMDRSKAAWITPFVTKVWQYSLATYGAMGPERVYAIFHQGKYGGGHPSYYYDAGHDNHNVSDVGGSDWNEGNWDVTSHELGHIVESTASHTKFGSPAFGLWKDSKWMEFYQYDVYLNIGMEEHAKVVFDRFTNTTDDFPRAGTHWFRDWFYPLWRDYGHAQVMVRFYGLLEQHYAATNKRMGAMTWGEYVHFTSGAAKKDLKPLATTAFGWPAEWDGQLAAAKQKYPQITY
jgi:hypothetical protein